MLKIEDLVLLPDGCSILSTVGTRRFQVLSRSEKDGYNTAQIQFLADIPISELQIKGNVNCWLSDSVVKESLIGA